MTDPYATLLVDTSRAPVGLGQRGAGVVARQLVYRHAGVQVELMLQPGGPAATFVWGRLSRAVTGLPCRDARVALLDGAERTVAESASDAFGEFSFASPRVFDGALAVEGGPGRFRCWLALRDGDFLDPTAGGPAA